MRQQLAYPVMMRLTPASFKKQTLNPRELEPIHGRRTCENMEAGKPWQKQKKESMYYLVAS